MTDALVTVFGGGGFVGRYVVEALLRRGARVRIAERSPKNAYYLKAQANLGQITYVPADITQPETLTAAIAGADAVINLVGSFVDMQRLHVEGAQNIAEAAARAGVKSLVHMSAIGADAQSKSAYGGTKGEGEAAVRKAFPKAVIVRPSIVFGREDAFINRFAALIRALPIVPIIGGKTRFQPVFAGDVGHAVAALVADPAAHGGKTYELGGPQILSMRQMNEWIATQTGRSPLFIDVPDVAAAALATLTGWLPGAPITRDQWIMLQSDNIVSAKARDLSTLGVSATPLDAVARGWLLIYRRHGRFGAAA
ncbi:MAG: complex I NDUFA9 subunit family protein [Sphingomonadaceae bacterium]|jgi:NADH dehydrogenase|nr:complex I NDUFA9 subunit family protein [Sphingomonadaceae bacterium]